MNHHIQFMLTEQQIAERAEIAGRRASVRQLSARRLRRPDGTAGIGAR